MTCPLCKHALKRSEIESTDTFPCPYCHKFLRRAAVPGALKSVRLLAAVLATFVLIAGTVGHSRPIRVFGGLAVVVSSIAEAVFRKQQPPNELEPAEPANHHH